MKILDPRVNLWPKGIVMRGLERDFGAAAPDAYLAWWSLAGVDGAVAEAPVNWLRPQPTRAQLAEQAAKAFAPPPPEKPKTLDAYLEWLAGDSAQPERKWPGTPILPTGPAEASLMVITDMPDMADAGAGHLFADRVGALFDAMMRAIGLRRDDICLASLFTVRPAGGMVEASDLAHVADRIRLHVHLAAPRRLLLLGDRTARALLPTDGADRPAGLRPFNHEGGTVPAIATFHPRLLLSQPAAKAECWRALQSLIEEDRP
ncbi:uracil-DNA glycosylase [Sphingobium sp. PAMC28499]|jgi:DNA polymerase|uniref:uracil-DNA glycosylase family protein n=1 Tax=Sphingobium sp. PAMC28499 TaxID=2565554 RepID=UPI00109DB969|nr:uracil-DNA glycosylase family protein [Sphingobium sp. PAMC28499]QCB39072.1 uracil-DNA glycosylase [Sphingobium sp. PAMC28499]